MDHLRPPFGPPNLPASVIRQKLIGLRKELDKQSREEAHCFYSICAFCEDSTAVLLRCQGPCKRAFHPTKSDGHFSDCDSLGFTEKEAREIKNSFYCKNCTYNQHQCFSCGKLGSSGKDNDAEVIKCARPMCNHFYHIECVAKLLPKVEEHVANEDETNVPDPKSFTCPVHVCCVCQGVENWDELDLQFAVCLRCPRSYHRKCLPSEINEGIGEGGETRLYDDMLPNRRIIIYCMNHAMNKQLLTPKRDHITFPETFDCGEDNKSSSVDDEFSKLRVDASNSN